MPRSYCTLFDSNYLTRGLALHDSLQRHEPGSTLIAFCMDEYTKDVLDRLGLPGLEPVALAELEEHDRELRGVKEDRTPLEYCWTATPSVALHSLARHPEVDLITYLDADVFFYSNADPLFDELGDDAVMIVPHRYAPETAHLEETSGIYNVELVSFRRDDDGLDALRWWHDRCIEWCYYRVEGGKLGDQKYLDDWPERFNRVHVLQHVGGGVAPWNVNNYRLTNAGDRTLVDGKPLVFYHFHGLRLFRNRRFVRGPEAGRPERYSVPGVTFDWASTFAAIPEQRRLVWAPYLAALSRALQLIRTVEPRFAGGLLEPTDPLWRRGRSRAGAAYRRLVGAR